MPELFNFSDPFGLTSTPANNSSSDLMGGFFGSTTPSITQPTVSPTTDWGADLWNTVQNWGGEFIKGIGSGLAGQLTGNGSATPQQAGQTLVRTGGQVQPLFVAQQPAQATAMPSWLLPVALVGIGLVAVMALMRR